MAILITLTEFNGSLGNISAYRRKDSDKVILRMKGGATKKKIKTAKSFERTRELNAEWGGCAKAAGSLRDLLVHIAPVADYNLSGPLTALAKNMQTRDPIHQRGERSILFSRFGSILEGFQLNKKNSFESVLRGSIDVQFNASQRSIVVQLPEMIHGINFHPVGNYAAWRIVVTLGILPDLYLLDGKYGSGLNGDLHNQVAKTWYSEWQFGTKNIVAQNCTIQLPPPTSISDDKKNKATEEPINISDTLAVAIGITFGTPLTDQLIKTNKHVGAGKILKVCLPS
jgi:hypothetical protein